MPVPKYIINTAAPSNNEVFSYLSKPNTLYSRKNKQLFASKYKLYLTTENELIEEIEREKAMILRERRERYGVHPG